MKEQCALMLEKVLFTSTKPDENEHRCVVAIDDAHAASYRHGQHSRLQMGEMVVLYNVSEPAKQYESTVVFMSDFNDIIIFKLNKDKFENFPRGTGQLFVERQYLQLGVSSSRTPIWKDGIISERKNAFYFGTSHGQPGDSGSALFDESGLFLGMALASERFSFFDRENVTVGEIADHHPDTRIITAESIFVLGEIVNEDVLAL